MGFFGYWLKYDFTLFYPEFSIELLLYVGDEESRDADMAIGWVDKKGKLHFEVGLPLGKGF